MSPWGWGANVVLFSGLWFVGNRLWWAFLLTAVGEVVWVVIAWNRGQIDLAAICAVFALVAVRNLLKWRNQPTIDTVVARLARHMGVGPRDPQVWGFLTCEGVTGEKGVTPLQQFDAGRGDRVLDWIERNWGTPPDGPIPDPTPDPKLRFHPDDAP